MISAIPTGTEAARPFLPSVDMAKSKAFYEALGFTKLLDSEVVIFAVGSTSFILTNFHDENFENNHMMQLMVDDLDAWWAHIVSLDLPSKFDLSMMKPPEMQPWGLRIAYIADPSGVLWHIGQRRPGKSHD
jgi:uncharacterized glyoxalase superfamily protein PhnB